MLNIHHIQHYPIGGENALRVKDHKGDIFKLTGLKNWGSSVTVNSDANNYDYPLHNIKPLLRPLSNLYKERNGKIDIVELAKISHPHYDWVLDDESGKAFSEAVGDEDLYFYFEIDSFYRDDSRGSSLWVENQLELFQYLFENHYDVFGLIEKGLAIDINKIEI